MSELQQLVWIVDLEPTNRDTGEIETFRLSDLGYTSLPTDTPADEVWETGLLDVPELTRSLASGRALGGEVQADPGAIRVASSRGRLGWTDPRRYAWRNARALVRVGLAGSSIADFVSFEYQVKGPPSGSGSIDFALTDASVELDEPFFGTDDHLLGMAYCLRVDHGGSIGLVPPSLITAASGFAARFLVRPSSLGDTRWGAGRMALLSCWNSGSSNGMKLYLDPTTGTSGSLTLEIPGLTPSSFSIERSWDVDRWASVAVNFTPAGSSWSVQVAVGQEILGAWSPTGSLSATYDALLMGDGNSANGFDLAHPQWVHGGIDPVEFASWITEPVPRSVGLAAYWWTFGDGGGQPQDSGPSKQHATVTADGTVRWVHSREGGIEQAGALRYVPLGDPVENVGSLLLDPNRYVYLASGRDNAKVRAVYSNAGELVESATDYLDWWMDVAYDTTPANFEMRIKLSDSGGRVIETGDFLLYEIQWTDEEFRAFGTTIGDSANLTVQIVFVDGTRTAVAGGTDQNGLSIAPDTDLGAYANDQWYLRLVSLETWVGKTIDYVEVMTYDETPGFTFRSVAGYTRRIEITDGLGSLREMIWAPRDGEPTTEVAYATVPANSSYTLTGPDGDWIQDGSIFQIFNDPQGTTITHDVRGDPATGFEPIAIASALALERGITLDSTTLDALLEELAVDEVLGIAEGPWSIDLNYSASNAALTAEQCVDEDPDLPDDDWIVTDTDTAFVFYVPGFELPSGPYLATGTHTIEMLLRRSNVSELTAPTYTLLLEQPAGTTLQTLASVVDLPDDGDGTARLSVAFDASLLDPLEPAFIRLQGNPGFDGGVAQPSTVEIGAIQLRVQRSSFAVAHLVDEDTTYRELINRIMTSGGIQWEIDRAKRFTASRLADPDDILGSPTSTVLRTSATFTMVAGNGAEYRVSLWSGSQAIASDTVLYYPVLWRGEPGIEQASVAVDLLLDDASTLSESGLVDDQGFPVRPAADLGAVAVGQWYYRRIPLGALAGRSITRVDLVCQKRNGGSAKAFLGPVTARAAGSAAVLATFWDGTGSSSFVSSSDPSQTGTLVAVFDRPRTADLELVEDDVLSIAPLEPEPPIWTEAAAYRPNHTVQTENVVTTATPERRLFLRDELRTEPLRRPEVLATYEDAIDGGTVSTVLVLAAEAHRLLERRSTFFGQPNRAFEIGLLFDDAQAFLDAVAAIDVGGSCWVVHPDHELFFGEGFRVIRFQIRDGVLSLTLWRPR